MQRAFERVKARSNFAPEPGKGRRRRLLPGLFLLLAITAASATAETAAERESAVRAAFLYRLSFFVAWPDEPPEADDSPFVVCVVGGPRSEVFRHLEQGARRWRVGKRPMQVRRLDAGSALDGCRIAYVEGSHDFQRGDKQLVVVDRLTRLDDIADLALVATESVNGETRLGFHADRGRLAKADFKLSSQLMQLLSFRPQSGTGKQ